MDECHNAVEQRKVEINELSERVEAQRRVIEKIDKEINESGASQASLRENIRVGVQYIEAWLGGRGAVPLYNLMEDAATAEISRAQVWQWIHLGATLDDGRAVTPELFRQALDDEMAKLRGALGEEAFEAGRFDAAIELFAAMSLAGDFEEFLTVPAYRQLG